MTAILPVRTGHHDDVELLHALDVTLTHADTITVSLGVLHAGDDPAQDRDCRRDALLALAAAEPDLLVDGHRDQLATAVALLASPDLSESARGYQWDSLAEALQMIAAWSSPMAADLFADPLPFGTSPEATAVAAVDAYEAQRDAALAVLLDGRAADPKLPGGGKPAVPDPGERIDAPAQPGKGGRS